VAAAAPDPAHHPRAPGSASLSGRTPRPPLAFDRAIYTRRNVVERCINRLKQWCGLATRYEKRAANYRAMVVLASIVNWLDS
jgi:transposase